MWEFFTTSLVFMLAPMFWSAIHVGAVTWDAFNHHIYLGRQAIEGSRLSYDYFATGSMSCQYPLGYAPLVWMLDNGWPGKYIFQVLAFLAALSAPASWLIMWSVVPGRTASAAMIRIAATALAMSGVLWWKLQGQTSNDALSMSLEIWAVALAMLCVEGQNEKKTRWQFIFCAVAGSLAGLGFVIKLSQFIGIAAVACIILFINGKWAYRFQLLSIFGLSALITFAIMGGAWAIASWDACGSPIYPFMVDYFRNLSMPWRM
ncbi:hypothetical protein [Comamonas koreensis]|uniref:Glycosyltransferase RgtA/B/C/D-like domain-containing protein n=1 Tax=Comamonas koreensis TaxID=160825 RepID=A0AAW4Y163_9BURK|nr:hypothetical protein [Comamonas koreensis]MCD2167615.1 hypothetical protein [Comamonas koreensis]